ncbi:MAG: hypothetical protein ACE366_28770 [Bradymonadia bacterium]
MVKMVLWGFICLGLMGCGEGAREVVPSQCDPYANTGCSEDAICRIVGDGQTLCLAQEAQPEAPCSPGSCAAGEACVEIEGLLGCKAICSPEGDCEDGASCAYRVGDSPWRLCIPPCDPLEGCGPSATCAPTPILPYPQCVADGTLDEDDPCGGAERCGHGLVCIQQDGAARCLPLCTPDDAVPCPEAQSCLGEIPGFTTIGFCPGG